MGDYGIEALLIRVHHHYWQLYPGFPELYPFVGIGNCQVIHTVELQCIGNLETPASIRKGFDHGHGLCFGFELRPEIVQVMDQCIQVDLHNRFVGLLLECPAYLFKLKHTCTLQQYCFVAESCK